MIIELFYPFEYNLSEYAHDDSQPSLESCDEYFFSDPGLFYEDSQPKLCSDFDRN
jgi:hypothetical protein